MRKTSTYQRWKLDECVRFKRSKMIVDILYRPWERLTATAAPPAGKYSDCWPGVKFSYTFSGSESWKIVTGWRVVVSQAGRFLV